MRIKIGDLLVKAGVITELQLKAALAEQSQWGGKLGDILVRMEFVTEEVLVRALSKQTGIPRAELGGTPNAQALEKIAPDIAEEYGVVPIELQDDGRTLVLAMSDPNNVMITDHLQTVTGVRIVPRLAGASAVRHAISRWYRGEELRDEVTDPRAAGISIVSNSGEETKFPATRLGGARPPNARPAKPAPQSVPPQQQVEVDLGQTMQMQKPRIPTAASADGTSSASEVLRGVEETQRRSVAALKAMVELLIEKGVFSRDEYLARVKR
jgi:hypothetical protein